jgi:hypothetical protein
MTDRRPTITRQGRKHLKTLERRVKYLTEVINEPNSPNSHAWDQAEISALTFALRTIENHYQKPQPTAESSTP